MDQFRLSRKIKSSRVSFDVEETYYIEEDLKLSFLLISRPWDPEKAYKTSKKSIVLNQTDPKYRQTK